MKHKKLDNIWLGVTLAFILTAIAFFIFYLINNHKFESIEKYIGYIRFTGLFSSVVSLSALPNLLLFFAFIWTNRYRSARGVLSMVIIITILVAILRMS